MGPIMAILLTLVFNLAPPGANAVELKMFLVEGVGVFAEPSVFALERAGGSSWLLHNAQGQPWLLLEADGGALAVADSAGANREKVDLTAALGLPAGAWWEAETVGPEGQAPLALERLPGGFDVRLEGALVATVRW